MRTPPYQQGNVKRERHPTPPRITGRIDTISGGFGGGGDSNNARKNYARREVYSFHKVTSVKPITFTDRDLQGIETPHEDPIVIAPLIGTTTVGRMLVDTGSSCDILYLSTYDQLNLPRSRLQPVNTALTGFTGHSVRPMGMVALDVTYGTDDSFATVLTKFTVVDVQDLSYNGLIGRPTLNALQAVVSPTHLKIKFPTVAGVGEMCGDQKKARVCYLNSVPPANKACKRERDGTPTVRAVHVGGQKFQEAGQSDSGAGWARKRGQEERVPEEKAEDKEEMQRNISTNQRK